MRTLRKIVTVLGLSTFGLCADQDILTILQQQDNLATFTAYVQQNQDIVDILNNGTFTLLAPNDAAIQALVTQQPNIDQEDALIRALIQYHVVNDTHPSATFGIEPLFPATLLSNPVYSNVTGGQRVELTSVNGKPTILSGVKAASHVVHADVFFIGGLIQIVDTVLTIPVSFPATITQAGLTDLVALLNKGGWLEPTSQAATIVNEFSDLTLMGPNSPDFGATFTGFDGLSQDQLNEIFGYAVIQGTVAYSSTLRNNTKYPTLDKGFSVHITQENGAFYADASKLISTDYLTSNGVLQILDSPLNPNTTNSRPAIIPTTSPSSKHGLSGPAAAGIGIALGVIFIGAAIVTALVLRKRRKQRRGLKRGSQRLRDAPDGGHLGQPNAGITARGPGVELAVTHNGQRQEFFHPDPGHQEYPPAYELDNKPYSNSASPVSATPSPTAGSATNFSYPTTLTSTPNNSGLPPMTTVVEIQSHSPPNSSRGHRKAPSPHEIDGLERSKISITVNTSGEPPRHLGFQARY